MHDAEAQLRDLLHDATSAAVGAVVATTAIWPTGTGGRPVADPEASSAIRPDPTGSAGSDWPCTTRPDATGAIDYVMFGNRQYEATGELLLPVPMPSSTLFPARRWERYGGCLVPTNRDGVR